MIHSGYFLYYLSMGIVVKGSGNLTRLAASIFMLIMTMTISLHAQACTLFGASGQWVEGGGTLIAKNRDWTPQDQEMKLISPKDGYRYYGLFAGNGKSSSLKGGINERGFVVFTATVGTIVREERLKMPHYKGGVMNTLLKKCSSVDEALAMHEIFLSPQFLILADNTKVAYVEIGPDGTYAVREETNGYIYHTNHYVEDSMQWANFKKPGPSSQVRYNRIGELLAAQQHPYSLDDFIGFSNDRHDGLHNSIWREGSDTGTQTLAAMVIYLPPHGSPVVYGKVRHNLAEKGKEEIFKVSANDIFNQSSL